MRLRFRFGLRWILILPVLVCLFLGMEKRRAHQQKQLADQVMAIRGSSLLRTHRRFLPVVLSDRLPTEYGKTITQVTTGGMASIPMGRWTTRGAYVSPAANRGTGAVSTRTLFRLINLPAMRKVKTFHLSGTSVDDDLVAAVARLSGCESIEVNRSAVTQSEYYPPTNRFFMNGPQAIESLHPNALRITRDLQIFAHAYEGEPKAIAKLLSLSQPGRPNIIIADTLSHLTSSKAIAVVRSGLSHTRPQVRATATTTLSRIPDIAGLIEAFDDEHPQVRRAAVQGVTFLTQNQPKLALNNEKLFQAMLARTGDSDANIRAEALNWLPKTGDTRCFSALVKGLNDSDASARTAAARGLGTLEDKRALPHLDQAKNDPNEFVNSHAERAIELLNDPDYDPTGDRRRTES